MKAARRKAFDQFAKGGAAMHVARRELGYKGALGMPSYAVKVAGAQGVGAAIEHVRDTTEKRKAARRRQKDARRRNR